MTDDTSDGGGDVPDDGGREAAVRSYYATLDAGAYDDLRALLAAGFVQRRPDRTVEGRDAFVAFMRDDRPRTATTHAVDAVYERTDAGVGVGNATGDGDANAGFAVRGRLVDADGTDLFGFVDVHGFGGERIAEIRTYTQ